MAGHRIPHFQNTAGHAAIEIGAKEFMCVGAHPPYDHPHVFLDMGHDAEKVCPYCSTLYKYSASNGSMHRTVIHPTMHMW